MEITRMMISANAFIAADGIGPSPEKRRRFPRQPCSGPVSVAWTIGDDKFTMGHCVDISISGMCIQVSEPMPIFGRVCLRSDRLSLNGSAIVRHCRRKNSKYLVGVDFAGGLRWVGKGCE